MDVWDHSVGNDSWNPVFERAFNDWEFDLVANLVIGLQNERVTTGLDKVTWKGVASASFSVREAFKSLSSGAAILFPSKGIWVPCVPTKAVFLRGKQHGERS